MQVRARTVAAGSRPMIRVVAALLALLAVAAPASAQEETSRFLAREHITLYGIGLKVEPVEQTVPRDIATIVSTFLQAPNDPGASLPPFAPNAVVRGTLRGPSFQTPLELTTTPNTPFNIPPLPVAGIHTLDDIRVESNGDVLLRGVPESVRINVIHDLLVTQVTARPLSAEEIRERGIVFDRSSFQAYNFTAAFAVQGTIVNLNFPVVLPSVQQPQDVGIDRVAIPSIQPPGLQTLRTIIPDTLQIQTQVPNLSVVGFSLKVPVLQGQDFFVPPIPGVIVFPGNIGFLNQFFSVLLMVSNAAPEGSGLVVSDLRASIVLPPGRDSVVNTPDDPLSMARTAAGETPRIRAVTQTGADGVLGTADDVLLLGPGQTGNAEYLVEGRREGSHVVEMELEGTLNGLPVGPVPIRGRAAGAVLVRNPTYTLTFIHPEVVSAGEPYTLDVAVTNTSESPANFVSVNLLARNLSGATLVGEAAQEVESIPPGDTATVTFSLISRVTGKVTAATLDSDAQVAGRFELKHAVGELGVPLSPESLVLPKEASALPKSLRDATLGLLGKAWAVATAPAAALPRDVQRFSRQIVLDMAVAAAEAGLRVRLGEPLPDSAAQLGMDLFGSLFTRLPEFNPAPSDLAFAENNYRGFDGLRRRSTRGEVFAQAIADLLSADLGARGAAAFHRNLAQKISYRPGHISVVAATAGLQLPVTLVVVDAEGRRLGGVNAQGQIVKDIPFGDELVFRNASGQAAGEMAFLVAPPSGAYTLRFEPVAGAPDVPFTLSVVVPTAGGFLRQVTFENVTRASLPTLPFTASDPYRLSMAPGLAGTPLALTADAVLDDPAPRLIGVVQQADADMLCLPPLRPGRVVAALFSEEVTAESVQDRFKTADITGYAPEANQVVSVALQPGRRIAFIALRDSLGPFVPRSMTISGVSDLRGNIMASQTEPMVSTIPDEGGVVSGRVIHADGTPVPFASVRLFVGCGNGWVGISGKNADAEGRYAWDFVLKGARIVAVDPESEEFRDVRFNIQRNGQRLNADIVMLGRGTFTGRTLSETGTPLRNTSIRITSQTDQSQYGATTDANGAFTVTRIPVGTLLIEAVNTERRARTFISEAIPFAGATTTRDIVLLDVESTQTTVKYGDVSGFVLRGDNATPVEGVPVVAYYETLSQPGVPCSGSGGECAVAMTTTDATGAFSFADIVAGKIRLETFDQASYQKGEVRIQLPFDGTLAANIVLASGLGTVRGVVLDSEGRGVANARVGGGLSLATTNSSGQFTLPDVPVGRVQIVAVSDALGAKGTAEIDIARAGEEVNATIVLDSTGGVAGVVRSAQGVPVAGIAVYVFKTLGGGITVVGQDTTDSQGGYAIDRIPLGDYTVSAFRSDFADGNVRTTAVKFAGQVAKADITFRGGGGRIIGRVLDDDGVTPLRGRVSVSGDQLRIAGGRVGVGFQHVANFQIVDSDFTTGQFALSNVWVGPFTLRAAGQFSPDPVALEGTMPSAGATVQMDIRLQPTSQVTGRVFQPDGVTPAGANLIVTYKSDEFRVFCSTSSAGEDSCVSIPQGIQEEIVVTDADGRFGLPLVNAGSFTITVEDLATRRTGRIKGTVKAGETLDVPLRLVGLGEITINVRGGDAQTPIPGARVEVTQVDFPNKSVTRFASELGTVVLGGGDAFSEGAFVVEATDVRDGFSGRASGRIERDGEQVTTPVFLFNQSGVVYGTVFKVDGATIVPNAEVIVSNNGGPLALTVTDGNGAYRVERVPLGAVTVEVFEAATARRGYATGQIFANQQEVPINVTEAALGVVRGTVLAAGPLVPLKAWTVRLNQSSVGGRGLPSLAAMSSVDGTFSFPGVSQGPVSLAASKQGVNGSGTATTVIQREGQAVDVPLLVEIVRPLFGHIEGRVVAPDGQPAANAQVRVCGGGCGGSALASAVSGGDGSFRFANLPLGRYEMTAQAQGSPNSGSTFAEIAIDEETVGVIVQLIGLSQVDGQVVRGDGSPASFVEVRLDAVPSSGCVLDCVKFADSNGRFSFVNLPARSFTVRATDTNGLKGIVGDTLNPGDVRTVRIVLEPTGSLRGRALRQNLSPAAGVTVDLEMSGRHFFRQTAADGTFEFDTTPLGTFSLDLEDPVGTGIAARSGTIGGTPVELGDIRLDEAPPVVASTTPAAGATAVPLAATVRIVFAEQVDAGTITAANISLSDGEGLVAGTLALGTGDTVVTFTPLAPFAQSTRYSLRVRGVKDIVGKVMAADYVATFQAVDLTPATHLDVSPAPGTSGVPVTTTIRVRFSEPIDPTRMTGPPIVLTGPTGPLAGQIDYAFGNTVVVLTPTFPLTEDASYRVQSPPATDLAGNVQAQGLDFTFGTTDRTPPQVLQLVAPATVIENAVANVVANVGTTHDVGFVDFFVNGVFVAVARSAPFTLSFQAVPSLGGAGDSITVTAIATDTSGNRGLPSAPATLTITADQPPVVTILAPPDGLTARNGDRVVVRVRAIDDLGITQQGYKAQTGQAQDTALRPVTPVSTDRTEEFAFHVPAGAAPGSTILVEASAADTKGQIGQATPIAVTVLDAVLPTVTITGASTGDAVRPGQPTTVVVAAQDLGGVRAITFAASGIVTVSDARTLDPAQNDTLTSFTFTVPASARPGDTVTLQATATDRAGNIGTAASVILPVADTVAPTAQIRTSTGSLNIVPGSSVSVIVDASDGIGVSRVELTGTGAFTVTDARQVSPPTGDAHVTFTIPVPATLQPGDVLNLQARAVDLSNNVSSPVFLSLTVRVLTDVVLPASAIVNAGRSIDVEVQLPSGAPPAGQLVTFTTSNTNVATVAPSVFFAAGQTTRTVAVMGQSGGTAQLKAFIQGVERAVMNVAVQGGVVDGFVFDSMLQPAVGVQVVVTGGGTANATTDALGRYQVIGINGPDVQVRALDPATSLRGYTAASMNRVNGFAHVDVVLIPAGSIHGTVFRANGTTPAGAGVRMDVFPASGGTSTPLATTFTDDAGTYEFPLVTVGSYRVDATAVDGNRGRSNASVTTSGQEVRADVTYLGRGSVFGTVLSGGGQPVPNALMTFSSNSLVGSVNITRPAESDGTFRFDNVFVGTFSVSARDPLTNRAASATGTISEDAQSVQRNLTLATYGTIRGTVFRADGVTPVAAAQVVLAGVGSTTTDDLGSYEFPIVALGSHTVTARESSTRGVGSAGGTLSTNLQTRVVDVTFVPQGTVVGTVVDANGAPSVGATLRVETRAPSGFEDVLSGMTDADGRAILPHVLAGTLKISASKGTLQGSVPDRTLAANEIAEVTVQLEPTASITGTVLAPDGQTPQTTGSVSIVYPGFNGGWQRFATTPLAADGTFRFDGLKLTQTYQLGAYDATNRLRALVKTPIALTANGEVATRAMTFVGLGTVTGRVVNPNGSSAPNFSVQVRSLNPDFGSIGSSTSNAGGFYQVTNLAVGAIAVSTGNVSQGLLGEAFGELTAHGQTLTLDVVLQSNAVTLPVTRTDANVASFEVQTNGSIQSGLASVFTGATAAGAMLLDVVSEGVEAPFTGGVIGTVEDQGREIAARQNGLAGLNVTRKVFVPANGYFARYLEILSNPTANPITVDLRVTSHMRTGTGAAVRSTSSGDATLDVTQPDTADRWVIVDDADQDPFIDANVPSLAFTFDGPGAAARAASAAFTTTTSCVGCSQTHHLIYRWDSVTVPAGGTVAYMHFLTQQVTRAGASAAVARLEQLPPEALAGLALDEIAAVENFAIPADGQSSLPVLPPLNGTVTGRIFEYDGVTVTPSATMQLRSLHPLFGRTYQAFAAGGQFSIESVLTGDFSQIVIPAGGFTLSARHGSSSVVSPAVTGTIAVEDMVGAADIVFTNTGMLTGRVLRATGQPVGSASAVLSSPGLFLISSTATDGSFLFLGLPDGQKTLTIGVPHPQGTGVTMSSTLATPTGTTTTFDVVLPAMGGITGIVRHGSGAPAVSLQVRVQLPTGSRFTNTDTSGRYTFTDVPIGVYPVSATEPVTQAVTSESTTVVANTTTTRDLSLVGIGTVAGTVTLASGVVVSGAQVQLFIGSSTSASATQTTNGSGAFSFINRPANQSYRVRVTNPAQTTQFKESASLPLTTHAQTLTLNVTLPAQATVRVTVRRSDTTLFNGARIQIRDAFDGPTTFREAGNANSSGVLLIPNVPEGSYTLRVLDPSSGAVLATATGAVVFGNQGQTLDILITTGTALPTNLFDGNANRFDIQTAGWIADGQNDAFNNGLALSLAPVSGGFTYFTGATVAGLEDNGREVAITQPNVAGLEVTRKIFVPADGYFARYVEVLRNPGATPIDVHVRMESFLGSGSQTRLLATSSGDTAFGTNDTWLVSDDDTVATHSGDPSLAFVFGGAGASRTLSGATHGNGSSTMTSRWDNVTIAPGQTVSFMHFVVQQFNQQVPSHNPDAGAIAAAQRLVQLPPEALVGLSADERTQIVNWAVPADGSSPVAPIAPRTGTVNGATIAGDGATVRANAPVFYRNASYPFFNAATRVVTSSNAGLFSFFGGVFIDSFTLQATDVGTNVLSPLVPGTFPEGQTTVTQNVVFSNTGIVRGRVLRNGVPAGDAGIYLDSSGSFSTFSFGSNGEYVLTGVLPGPHVVNAQGAGGSAFGSINVIVVAGQTVANADIVIAAGTISGQITRANGTPVGITTASLLNPDGSVYMTATTTASGGYGFGSLPLGRPFFVRSQFPGVPGSVTTTAAAAVLTADSQILTVNLAVRPFAVVRASVFDADGSPLIVPVYIDRGNGQQQFAGTPNELGQVFINNVVGDFTVRALDDYGVVDEEAGSVAVAEDGTTKAVNLQATTVAGTISGSMFAADGMTRLPDDEGGDFGRAYVELLDAQTGDLVTVAGGSASEYQLNAVMPIGSQFLLRAHPPYPLDFENVVERTGQFTRRGETIRIDLTLPVGVISGTVRFPGGAAVAYPNALLRRAASPTNETFYATRADEAGGFGIIVMEAGEYVLTVQDPQSGLSATVPVSVTDPSILVNVGDVVLPETTALFGIVRDHDGNPVSDAGVAMASVGLEFSPYTTSDSSGYFSFPLVPLGPYRVQACRFDPDGFDECGSVEGTALSANPDIEVILSGFGAVQGMVYESNGTTPAAPVGVTVYQWNYEGPVNSYPFRRSRAAEDGFFQVNSVPSGQVVVTARNQNTGEFGVAKVDVTPDTTAVVNVTLSNAFDYDYDSIKNLAGQMFRTDVNCEGAVVGGGLLVNGFTAVNNAQRMDVFPTASSAQGDGFPCLPYAGLDMNGRQVTFEGGYRPRNGLHVSRQVFVPEFGPSITRYLEVLENRSQVDLTVRVRISGTLGADSPFLNVNDGPVVMLADGNGERPTVGLVFGSYNPWQVTGTFVIDPDDQRRYFYDWVVTIPAGQTQRLMHFFVQDPVGNFDSATLFGLAYLDGQNPQMLDGLSEEVKQSIVNFRIEP